MDDDLLLLSVHCLACNTRKTSVIAKLSYTVALDGHAITAVWLQTMSDLLAAGLNRRATELTPRFFPGKALRERTCCPSLEDTLGTVL